MEKAYLWRKVTIGSGWSCSYRSSMALFASMDYFLRRLRLAFPRVCYRPAQSNSRGVAERGGMEEILKGQPLAR